MCGRFDGAARPPPPPRSRLARPSFRDVPGEVRWPFSEARQVSGVSSSFTLPLADLAGKRPPAQKRATASWHLHGGSKATARTLRHPEIPRRDRSAFLDGFCIFRLALAAFAVQLLRRHFRLTRRGKSIAVSTTKRHVLTQCRSQMDTLCSRRGYGGNMLPAKDLRTDSRLSKSLGALPFFDSVDHGRKGLLVFC